ncbi:MAG: hypothetical protein GJ680_18260 [Alteromonadaceae bacterium]|nr:hypothetical protein [Alteromonadaceae bacterium]
MNIRRFLHSIFFILASASMSVHGQTSTEADTSVNPACPDANILTNVFSQVCWDCFIESVSLLGVDIGNEPDGDHDGGPVCTCGGGLNIKAGVPIGMFTPTKIQESTVTPYCSPALNMKLVDTELGLGTNDTSTTDTDESASAFYNSHYFSYPLMTMMGMLTMPECTDGWQDFDLLYISEISPEHNNDMFSALLNPISLLMSSPLALAYCAADCVMTTINQQQEESFGCAGCDGSSLYPLTGNITGQTDPVAAASLMAQRTLASLHHKGMAQKTIGTDALCSPTWNYTIPRSQYKFSMIYPVPEAGGEDSDAWAISAREGSDTQATLKTAGQSGQDMDAFKGCCHPMGMSTARWCTPYGGRTRPGKDTAYLFMIWNYRDCCATSITQ